VDVPLQKRHKYAVRRSDTTDSFSRGTGLDFCINQCIRIVARWYRITLFRIFITALVDITLNLVDEYIRAVKTQIVISTLMKQMGNIYPLFF